MAMQERFQRSDIAVLAICLLLAIASVWFQTQNHHKAFPEHTIRFDVSRQEAKKQAAEFLEKQQIDISHYQHAIAFTYNQGAKTFIEKELGIQEARQLLARDFRLWRWSNRWFIPLTREEIKVDITPTGELVHFEHTLPEERPAPVLNIDEARRLSQRFLSNTINIDIRDWEFTEDKTEVKPNRVDYFFTYKKKGVEVYNATYRFDIGVQGEQIGLYREFLHIPEEWQRDYQHLRSMNHTTAATADVLFVLIIIAAIVVLFRRSGYHYLNFRTALLFGSVAFLLKLLSEINQLPLYKFYFDTNQTLGAFYGVLLVEIILESLLIGLFVVLFTGVGELLYRREYPHKIALPKLFSLKGIRTKSFFFSMVVGISLALLFLAFQTLFYLLAKRYGAWAPASISYTNLLNTAFPWIIIIVGGFLPAVTEEFSFRMFAIPFFRRALKSTFLAILIPAVIWGFAHANYPNQPFWIRGVEVSLFGLFIGFIFIKFNILTVLIWHYTIDAVHSAIFLTRTGDIQHLISSVIVLGLLLIPLIYNLISYFRRNGFESPESITNIRQVSSQPESTAEASPEECKPTITYRPFALKHYRRGFVITLILGLSLFIPVQKVGDFFRFSVPREEVIKTARQFLQKRGTDPNNFREAIAARQNYRSLWGRYILENSTLERLNRILARQLTSAVVWRVRFYNDGEKEEYRIDIHPSESRVVGFEHIIPENAAAISLQKESARFLAEDFLTDFGYSASDFELAENYSQQLPNRKDHTFIWEADSLHPANVGAAVLRIKIRINGDEVSAFSNYYKLPEQWSRHRTRKTLLNTVKLVLEIFIAVLVVIFIFISMTRQIKEAAVRWGRPLKIIAVMTILLLIANLLSLPPARVDYPTSWSLQVWTLLWILIQFLKTLFAGAIALMLLVAINLVYPDAIHSFRRGCRRVFARDAVLTAVLVTVGIFAAQQIGLGIVRLLIPAGSPTQLNIPAFISTPLPLFNASLMIIYRSLMLTLILGLILYCLKYFLPNPVSRIGAVAGLLIIYLPDSATTFPVFAAKYIYFGLLLAWLGISIRYFLRDNYPAYLLTAVTYFSIYTIIRLFESGTPYGKITALFLMVFIALLYLWIVTDVQKTDLRAMLRGFIRKYVEK